MFKRIAAKRSPESHLAGATVLHRAADTPGFSQDLVFFPDVEDSVARSAETDVATVRMWGYSLAELRGKASECLYINHDEYAKQVTDMTFPINCEKERGDH